MRRCRLARATARRRCGGGAPGGGGVLDEQRLARAVTSERIHGSIAHDLGIAILTGRHQPGDTLPGEIEFSEQLGASRSAYREAVRILAGKGKPAQDGHALGEMTRFGLATDEGRAADQAFHQAVLGAARNAPLIALSSSIAAAVSWPTIFKQRKGKLPRDPLPDHRRIYEAIAGTDPAAARAAMTDLVRLALQDTELSL